MSTDITFFIVVGQNSVDGVYVRGIFKDWNKAAALVDGQPELRIRSVTTLEESL